MYTFEEVTGTTWKLLDYKLTNGMVFRLHLPTNNNKVIISANDTVVAFLTWNSFNKCYEITYQKPGAFHSFGIDMNGNLWIYNTDKSLDLESKIIPVEIFSDYELEEYTFSGTNINTNIVLYSRNFSGDYLASNLQVTLTGPVKFADDGSNKKNITTSELGEIKVPVIINGGGELRIHYELI